MTSSFPIPMECWHFLFWSSITGTRINLVFDVTAFLDLRKHKMLNNPFLQKEKFFFFGNYISYGVLFCFYKPFQHVYTCSLVALITSKNEHRRWEVFLFYFIKIPFWTIIGTLDICPTLIFCFTISYLGNVKLGKVISWNIKHNFRD